MTDYLRDPNGLNASTDDDLPGMWEAADFMGGDPDERSYAQRERDAQGTATIVGNSFAIRRLEAYDDSYLTVGHAFLDALDIDYDTETVMVWGDPKPVLIEFTLENVNPDLLELIFGQPMVPLCLHELPAEGTE